jgi:hypothetical protein
VLSSTGNVLKELDAPATKRSGREWAFTRYATPQSTALTTAAQSAEVNQCLF